MTAVTPATAFSLQSVSLEFPAPSVKQLFSSRFFSSLLGRTVTDQIQYKKFLALDNLNFQILQGDRVALIGHNGAGKSTLLRLLAGIYKPSHGTLTVSSRPYALLDKSFITSTDLSGIEAATAAYLQINKSLKGFDEFLLEISEFTELQAFMSKPIASYSDGMRTRLLFALLTAFYHPILLIDEIFGVGDRAFFEKAQERLDNFLKKSGTLVFASHNDDLLHRYCNKAILLSHGRIVQIGSLDSVLSTYHSRTDHL